MSISKIAKRTYRDAYGRKISAAEWIKLQGGEKDIETKIRKLYFGKSSEGEITLKEIPKLKVTENKRYNFAPTSEKRIEIGREPKALQNKTIKSLRQNTKYENRTNEPLHISNRVTQDKIKAYEQANKFNLQKQREAGHNIKKSDYVVPGVILGAGLLSLAGAKVYDKISDKKKEEKKHEREQYVR